MDLGIINSMKEVFIKITVLTLENDVFKLKIMRHETLWGTLFVS